MSARPACHRISERKHTKSQAPAWAPGRGAFRAQPQVPTGTPRFALTQRWGSPPAQGHGAEAGAQGCKHRRRSAGTRPILQKGKLRLAGGGGGGWAPGAQGELSPAGSVRWRERGDDSKVTVASGAAEPTRRSAHLGREQQQGRGQPRRRHVRRFHRSSKRKVSRQRLRGRATRRRRPCACADCPLAVRGGAAPAQSGARRQDGGERSWIAGDSRDPCTRDCGSESRDHRRTDERAADARRRTGRQGRGGMGITWDCRPGDMGITDRASWGC